jgi:hypothetical protein
MFLSRRQPARLSAVAAAPVVKLEKSSLGTIVLYSAWMRHDTLMSHDTHVGSCTPYSLQKICCSTVGEFDLVCHTCILSQSKTNNPWQASPECWSGNRLWRFRGDSPTRTPAWPIELEHASDHIIRSEMRCFYI